MKIKILLMTTFLSIGLSANAQHQKNIVDEAIEAMVEDSYFKNAQIGVLAIDTKTGDIIAEYNPDKSLTPASNMKLFSTSCALELYGPDYQFETKIIQSGKIDKNGILQGNIIIRGGGDPTMGSKFYDIDGLYLEKFSQAIINAGIKGIRGNIIADATIYDKEMVPTTWSWEDMGNSYGAVPCGICTNDNYLTLHFKTGEQGTIAEYLYSEPEYPGMTVLCKATAENITHENTNTFGKAYEVNKIIAGPMPKNQNDVTVKSIIPDPAFFVANKLRENLINKDIAVYGKAINAFFMDNYQPDANKEKEILNLKSPTLSEIIRMTNLYSVNLFAEHCLCLIGLKRINTTDVNLASNTLMAWWKEKGMDIGGLSINDGCGLSHYDIATPRQLCYLLQYMKNNSKYYKEFNESLTMCGGKGTMSSMCRGTRAVNNARGKSGTIRRVKSYSGYVKSLSGRELAFSIITNNFTCTGNEARTRMEKIITALANYNE
ncbi:MAG: D-alanyl-D-alanine carboxypeptidase/D-alanyl-D-alanine-endopeptidase [Bacteroidales bacterium]|nr:D-alanyl-D-alanine carboxypeptidase/D-alanyl-D-alanine-endopeptidase [Bacteroidales bacterium]